MIMQAKWDNSKYSIPAHFNNNIMLCGALSNQTPEILESERAGNLFMYCAKPNHGNRDYRTLSVVYSSSDYHDKTLNDGMHTTSHRIQAGTKQERKRAVVIATVEFLNQIIRDEKDEGY